MGDLANRRTNTPRNFVTVIPLNTCEWVFEGGREGGGREGGRREGGRREGGREGGREGEREGGRDDRIRTGRQKRYHCNRLRKGLTSCNTVILPVWAQILKFQMCISQKWKQLHMQKYHTKCKWNLVD